MSNALSEFVRERCQKATSLSAEIYLRERIRTYLSSHPRAGVEWKIDGTRGFLMSAEKHAYVVTKHNGIYLPPYGLTVPKHSIFDVEFKLDIKTGVYKFLWIFDVLQLKGDPEIGRCTYLVRKATLQDITYPQYPQKPGGIEISNPFVRLMPWEVLDEVGPIEARYFDALTRGYEGLMLKDIKAPYGTSPNAWFKLKAFDTGDVVVIGPKAGKTSCWGVGVYASNGSLVEICDASSPIAGVDVGQIRAGTVLEVRYQPTEGYTALRNPVILRIRKDKAPEECTVDQFPWMQGQERFK